MFPINRIINLTVQHYHKSIQSSLFNLEIARRDGELKLLVVRRFPRFRHRYVSLETAPLFLQLFNNVYSFPFLYSCENEMVVNLL